MYMEFERFDKGLTDSHVKCFAAFMPIIPLVLFHAVKSDGRMLYVDYQLDRDSADTSHHACEIIPD